MVRISVIIIFFGNNISFLPNLYENIYSMVLNELITREGGLSFFFLFLPSTVARREEEKKISFPRFQVKSREETRLVDQNLFWSEAHPTPSKLTVILSATTGEFPAAAVAAATFAALSAAAAAAFSALVSRRIQLEPLSIRSIRT
jgi:hypothetical protein